MLISSPPTDWKALQAEVARILSECGMETEVEHPLPLVRGQADIDVYAVDRDNQPPIIYACECKHWASAVPQTIVHAFRQVVTDAGANCGLLIAKSGFQSGAYEAADKSNVKLLTWEQFNSIFAERWVDNHLRPTLESINEPLVDYTEEMNTKVIRHTMPFDDSRRTQFAGLRERHGALAFFSLTIYRLWGAPHSLALPLRVSSPHLAKALPAEVVDEKMLRPLLERLIKHIESALEEFDTFFGGRV